jgi:hypothetical protein
MELQVVALIAQGLKKYYPRSNFGERAGFLMNAPELLDKEVYDNPHQTV